MRDLHVAIGEQVSTELKTTIYGQNSNLDSLGLVSLILNLEQHIEDSFNQPISLADEKAMSQKHNPFENIDRLADYILKLIEHE